MLLCIFPFGFTYQTSPFWRGFHHIGLLVAVGIVDDFVNTFVLNSVTVVDIIADSVFALLHFWVSAFAAAIAQVVIHIVVSIFFYCECNCGQCCFLVVF